MTRKEILDQLKSLPTVERLSIIEAALHFVHEDIQSASYHSDKTQKLAAAAKTLLPDYSAGGVSRHLLFSIPRSFMRRGEVWLINLDPAIGSEIKKIRPAVIVNSDAIGILPLKIIVRITDWKDRYSVAPWLVQLEADKENGLSKTSAADTFQVRSVAQERFVANRETARYGHAGNRQSVGCRTKHPSVVVPVDPSP